jgi:hypothetical protein
MTALARTSSIYKRQTRPLVRESGPQKQDRNCQTVINIRSWAPDRARHQDLLTDRQSQCDFDFDNRTIPCGGGVEYLHRSPASRRRRRKRKSGTWDSKIWSRVPRDLGTKMTALVRARTTDQSSHHRERPILTKPQMSDSNKHLVVSPGWVLYSKTDWPTGRRS